jgi:hypothetical protein
MTEKQKKEMVQEILDRIMYLPSTKRRDFLDMLHDSFEEYPLEYTLNDRGMRVYTNPNFKTEQSCA